MERNKWWVNKRLRRNDAPGPNKLERWGEIAVGVYAVVLVTGMVEFILWIKRNGL